MSLFKACDWWNTICGSDEEFDKGCLTVANVDNSIDKSDKIIIGSYSGILRIYKPQPVKQDDSTNSSFRADELLLEAQLSFPILQVKTGVFASNSSEIQLAVLHPFKLSVYSVSALDGSVEHGTHYKLSLLYEHNLQRHTFFFATGSFGGTKGKDMMCVQCLDGTLNYFEQERFSFSRFLPKSLLPGPLVYAPKTDSFVTVAGFCVESYRFQTLASASEESGENENVTYKGKKVAPDWTYILGDTALDIVHVEDNISPTLVILGEKCLYALNCHGTSKFSKKLSFTPRCFTSYKEDHHGFLIILIITLNQTLLIYNETQLKWAAQLTFPPVCIQRASFSDVKGILVLLSEQGCLSCCYLGTEPSLFVSPLAEPKEIDFNEAEQEMSKLKKIIKSSNQNLLGTQKLGNEISLSLSVSSQLNAPIVENQEEKKLNFGPVPSVPVKIQIKCRTLVHDVRLMIHVEPPLKATQTVFAFGSVMEITQAVINVSMESPYIPSSLKLTAQAAYINSYGAPRIVEISSLLPLNLVAKSCLPAKDAESKITIDLNKKPVLLSELFPDLCSDASSNPGGAMGIEYYSGQLVSILPSKTSYRYRLQSDHLSALWLVTSELVRRLNYKFRKESDNTKLKCAFSPPLPLQEYFKVIDEHFNNRQDMEEVEELIAHRSVQFRVVQKRLLTKLKDSTPTPLNNLDTLLEATHRHIISVTDSIDKHKKTLESSICALSCATNLILLLLKLSSELKEDEWTFLTACFSPQVEFDSPQGWEEKVNVSLTYVLKFCFGKGMQESKFPDANLDALKDLSKLKKHITLTVDKILKNSPLNIAGAYFDVGGESTSDLNLNRGSLDDDDDEMTLPAGCRFVDNTSRPTSSTIAQDSFAEDASNGNIEDDHIYQSLEDLAEEKFSETFNEMDGEEIII